MQNGGKKGKHGLKNNASISGADRKPIDAVQSSRKE